MPQVHEQKKSLSHATKLLVGLVAFAVLITVSFLLMAPAVLDKVAHQTFNGALQPLKGSSDIVGEVSLATAKEIGLKLRYWERPLLVKDFKTFGGKDSINKGLYLLFEDDTGGWNNIRIAFEVFVAVAWITGRTLVLPPRASFYLLDRGPIKAFDKKSAKRSTSSYCDYYNCDLLLDEVNVITTEEFFEIEHDLIFGSMPDHVQMELKSHNVFVNGHHSEYFLWLREFEETEIWPTGPKVNERFHPANVDSMRDPAHFKKILYFPMHVSQNLRYLGGVPSLLRPLQGFPSFLENNQKLHSAVKKLIREHLVYSEHIIAKAVELIGILGGIGSYSTAHIRRNELQYKFVFLSAKKSLGNMKHLLKANEKIYIATDEVEPGFFQAFEEEGYTLVRLQNLKEIYPHLFEDFHPKYEGMLEQLICASGREFFATPSSTFSSYILRLRGYIFGESPQSRCHFHTDSPALAKDDCATTFKGDIMLWKL